jgi:cobaltochelatase CobS
MTNLVFEHLCQTYDALKDEGVSNLRSEVRNLGYKGTFIAFMDKESCIYAIHGHHNKYTNWQSDIEKPSFSESFKESLEVSREQLQHIQQTEPQPTQEPQPMAQATAPQGLAEEMALIMQKYSQPQGIDEEAVRKLIQAEVQGLKPREIQITLPNIEPKTIGAQHEHFDKLLKVLASGGNAFLVGEAGSGKTTAGFNVAEALGIKYGLIACNEMTDSFNFVGYNDANGKYVPGVAYDLYKNGGVLIVDEMEKGGANAMTSLNAMLANDRFEFPNNEIVKKHEDFKCVACGNTYGRGASRQYVGANELDASTLDRFDVLEWDIDNNLELAIATNKEWCSLVQGLREAVRSFDGTVQLIVSMRATLRGEKLLSMGFEHREVFEMLVYKGLDAATKKKVADKASDIMVEKSQGAN